MKKIILGFLLLGIFSCKKKDDKKEEEMPPVVTPTSGNTMTAKVNGNSWIIAGNNTSGAKLEQGNDPSTPKKYVFYGRTGSSIYTNAIWLYTPYAAGTVDLRNTPGCSAIYFDGTGAAFYVKSGSMNISIMDTSHVKSTNCDKFKATFNFTTDSVGGKGYSITEGSIDFVAP